MYIVHWIVIVLADITARPFTSYAFIIHYAFLRLVIIKANVLAGVHK